MELTELVVANSTKWWPNRSFVDVRLEALVGWCGPRQKLLFQWLRAPGDIYRNRMLHYIQYWWPRQTAEEEKNQKKAMKTWTFLMLMSYVPKKSSSKFFTFRILTASIEPLAARISWGLLNCLSLLCISCCDRSTDCELAPERSFIWRTFRIGMVWDGWLRASPLLSYCTKVEWKN